MRNLCAFVFHSDIKFDCCFAIYNQTAGLGMHVHEGEIFGEDWQLERFMGSV